MGEPEKSAEDPVPANPAQPAKEDESALPPELEADHPAPKSSQADLLPEPAPAALPISAREAAETILRWAKDNRLFARQPMEDAAEAVLDDDQTEVVPAQMFAVPAVAEVLRRRAINLITFNENAAKVVVFTKSKVSAGDMKTLPYALSGVSVEYSVGGVPAVKGTMPQPHDTYPYKLHKGKYCCGSSIFPGNHIGAGTIGLLATDAAGVLYGVSNNHVAGACNHAHPGLPIMAPGPLDIQDNSIDPFCIGRHSRLLPINDGIPENVDISTNIDAACFRISDPDELCSMQGDVCDTPIDIGDPEPSSIVEKVGRTTGTTRGRVIGQSIAPVAVSYNVPEYRMQKAVYFNSVFIVEGLAGDFAKRGDSGALVMSVKPDGSRKSVGLVFAVDETKSLTYVLALPNILSKFGLTICGNWNL